MPIRVALALAVPLAGLVLLLARSELDAHWQHNPSHFWLVLLAAVVNVGLGALAGDAARRRADARLVLVSLAFMTSAGFLGLHAAATPTVLLAGPSTGFVIATQIGLLGAGVLVALSALEIDPVRAAAIARAQRPLGLAFAALLAAWGAVSLASLPPLDEPISEGTADILLSALAAPGVALYAFAAYRYLALFRLRGANLLLALAAAFVLLAEAMIAGALARNWHASWWEWHVLMAIAFGLVAWSARAEYRRQASPLGVFSGVYLEETVERVDQRSADALKALVGALERGEPLEPVLAELRGRDGISGEEAGALERSAREIRTLDELFRPYLSPQLAARMREDPRLAELGGEEREVSVLFADLQGFTAFSEGHSPGEVVAMLNRYWAVTVPTLLDEDGTIEGFAGDAVMAVFNVAGDQGDHALRAARAGLALQRAADEIAAGRADWPRFRVGVNSGPAVVGNVGSREQRSFATIGDTVNLASRLQTYAQPGQVVLGAGTYAQVEGLARVEPLGPLELKGKSRPVEAYALLGLEAGRLDSGTTTDRGD
ncbi:MAG: adenylate/guanylate cyclase domain-containing protein [Gaiellaceae bacterium]